MSTRHSVAPMLVVCLLLGYGTAWTQVLHPEDPGKQAQTAQPTTALRSTVDLETLNSQKTTAAYQQQLKRLGDEARVQEKRNAQLRQDIEWLVCLDQLGIAIGPFLAGLGIVGLAIDFASQSLCKDVINGLFILFEDSLSIGDVVRVRGTSGLVEKMTLPSVTLRDLSGSVHVIPNSTIDIVTNVPKEYSYYVLDVSIAIMKTSIPSCTFCTRLTKRCAATRSTAERSSSHWRGWGWNDLIHRQ